jgi:hypothetical protein
MTGITRNAVGRLWCGEMTESRHRHDFVECSWGAIVVEGGHDDARLSGAGPETAAWETLYQPRGAEDVPEPLAIRRKREQ